MRGIGIKKENQICAWGWKKTIVLMFPSLEGDAFKNRDIILFNCCSHDISFWDVCLLWSWICFCGNFVNSSKP
jgi:hypothetical protein